MPSLLMECLLGHVSVVEPTVTQLVLVVFLQEEEDEVPEEEIEGLPEEEAQDGGAPGEEEEPLEVQVETTEADSSLDSGQTQLRPLLLHYMNLQKAKTPQKKFPMRPKVRIFGQRKRKNG